MILFIIKLTNDTMHLELIKRDMQTNIFMTYAFFILNKR